MHWDQIGQNTAVSVGFWAEKFNLVSNNHRRTQKLRLLCFRREISFLSKFGPKINIASLSKNLVPKLIPMVMFIFSDFLPETPFLGKFGPKIQNCQFKEV